jgi:hypothetical protein
LPDKYAVIKAQIPTALAMLVANFLLLYFLMQCARRLVLPSLPDTPYASILLPVPRRSSKCGPDQARSYSESRSAG